MHRLMQRISDVAEGPIAKIVACSIVGALLGLGLAVKKLRDPDASIDWPTAISGSAFVGCLAGLVLTFKDWLGARKARKSLVDPDLERQLSQNKRDRW